MTWGPGASGQHWHKDDYVGDRNVRHHRFRWVMAFYYPQDVSADMGPTAIVPGRQFYNTVYDNDLARSVGRTRNRTQLRRRIGPAGTP